MEIIALRYVEITLVKSLLYDNLIQGIGTIQLLQYCYMKTMLAEAAVLFKHEHPIVRLFVVFFCTIGQNCELGIFWWLLFYFRIICEVDWMM